MGYFGKNGRLEVTRKTDRHVREIFVRCVDASSDGLGKDISYSTANSIRGLGDYIEYNSVAATLAGPALAAKAIKSPGHAKVACHAITENLHRFQAMTKGYERAVFGRQSLLLRALKAAEVDDADGAIALRLELSAHFLRSYTGASLSPQVLATLHESIRLLRGEPVGPQSHAGAMRLVREYAGFYTRNCSYMPPDHGVVEVVDAYAQAPYEYNSPTERAVDIFFVAELRGTSRARPREFVDLDCQAIALEAQDLLRAQPRPGPAFLRMVSARSDPQSGRTLPATRAPGGGCVSVRSAAATAVAGSAGAAAEMSLSLSDTAELAGATPHTRDADTPRGIPSDERAKSAPFGPPNFTTSPRRTDIVDVNVTTASPPSAASMSMSDNSFFGAAPPTPASTLSRPASETALLFAAVPPRESGGTTQRASDGAGAPHLPPAPAAAAFTSGDSAAFHAYEPSYMPFAATSVRPSDLSGSHIGGRMGSITATRVAQPTASARDSRGSQLGAEQGVAQSVALPFDAHPVAGTTWQTRAHPMPYGEDHDAQATCVGDAAATATGPDLVQVAPPAEHDQKAGAAWDVGQAESGSLAHMTDAAATPRHCTEASYSEALSNTTATTVLATARFNSIAAPCASQLGTAEHAQLGSIGDDSTPADSLAPNVHMPSLQHSIEPPPPLGDTAAPEALSAPAGEAGNAPEPQDAQQPPHAAAACTRSTYTRADWQRFDDAVADDVSAASVRAQDPHSQPQTQDLLRPAHFAALSMAEAREDMSFMSQASQVEQQAARSGVTAASKFAPPKPEHVTMAIAFAQLPRTVRQRRISGGSGAPGAVAAAGSAFASSAAAAGAETESASTSSAFDTQEAPADEHRNALYHTAPEPQTAWHRQAVAVPTAVGDTAAHSDAWHHRAPLEPPAPSQAFVRPRSIGTTRPNCPDHSARRLSHAAHRDAHVPVQCNSTAPILAPSRPRKPPVPQQARRTDSARAASIRRQATPPLPLQHSHTASWRLNKQQQRGAAPSPVPTASLRTTNRSGRVRRSAALLDLFGDTRPVAPGAHPQDSPQAQVHARQRSAAQSPTRMATPPWRSGTMRQSGGRALFDSMDSHGSGDGNAAVKGPALQQRGSGSAGASAWVGGCVPRSPRSPRRAATHIASQPEAPSTTTADQAGGAVTTHALRIDRAVNTASTNQKSSCMSPRRKRQQLAGQHTKGATDQQGWGWSMLSPRSRMRRNNSQAL